MSTLKTTTITAIAAWILAAGSASADILSVPGQFPTIQQAINAAQDGDTIRVDPGAYNEDLTIQGKTFLRIEGFQGQFTFVKSAFVQNSNAIFFQDLYFQGNPTQGIQTLSAVSVVLARCHFADMAFAMSTNLTTNIDIVDCTFLRTKLDFINTDDIFMLGSKVGAGEVSYQACEEVVVRDSKFNGSALFANQCPGMIWEANNFKKSRLALANSAGNAVIGNKFVKGLENDPLNVGFGLWTRISDSTIADNNFKKTGPLGGIKVEGTGNDVLRNKGRRSQGNGLHITGSGNRIEGNNVKKSAAFDLFDATSGQNEYVDNTFQTSNL